MALIAPIYPKRPCFAGEIHVVKKGENLWDIVGQKRQRLSLTLISNYSELKDGWLIHPGQKICLPRRLWQYIHLEDVRGGKYAEGVLRTLVRALKAPDVRVRKAAVWDLGTIGAFAQPVIPELQCLMRDDPQIAEVAAMALKRIQGISEVVPKSDVLLEEAKPVKKKDP